MALRSYTYIHIHPPIHVCRTIYTPVSPPDNSAVHYMLDCATAFRGTRSSPAPLYTSTLTYTYPHRHIPAKNGYSSTEQKARRTRLIYEFEPINVYPPRRKKHDYTSIPICTIYENEYTHARERGCCNVRLCCYITSPFVESERERAEKHIRAAIKSLRAQPWRALKASERQDRFVYRHVCVVHTRARRATNASFRAPAYIYIRAKRQYVRMVSRSGEKEEARKARREITAAARKMRLSLCRIGDFTRTRLVLFCERVVEGVLRDMGLVYF